MDNPNINKLISSRDFAKGNGGGGSNSYPQPPKEPGKNAPQSEWDAYHKAYKSYLKAVELYNSPVKTKPLFDSLKKTVKSTAKSVKAQFTDPNSMVQKIAERGYEDDPNVTQEEKDEFLETQKSGDAISRLINTGTGVAKAGSQSIEKLKTQLGGNVDRRYKKTADQLTEALKDYGVEISGSNVKFTKGYEQSKLDNIANRTSELDNLIKDIEDKKKLIGENKPTLSDFPNQGLAIYENAVKDWEKDQKRLSKEISDSSYTRARKEQELRALQSEKANFENLQEETRRKAEKDLAKAQAKDKEENDSRAFKQAKKIASGASDTVSSALDMVSSKHAAKSARKQGAGGVKAKNARVAYMLGDRSLGTKIMSGNLFKGRNFVSRFVNRRVNKAAIRHYNNKGFSEDVSVDEIDARRDYESQVIAFMLNKDYSKFEDFSEIARPTVVKQSKVGMEKLDTGETLVDAVELPYVKEGSGISDSIDILEKNYYMASPEEKRFQESLTMGFSEDDSNGNEYEKTLESLSKIVNPYE